ncbi:co-chaperone HscB [Pseudocolwellia sp. AS88]|uniref:co-chaperone HscB n=1 Tax=Pseudocolwellia TaxID=2848177 RepID=UPI0026F17407|nr:co-chaperone HscB [Pseudocolwellia sp. AS88]MDO7085736.1 co-chaperone HscB [Pseudocolwellia sp. AS88]
MNYFQLFGLEDQFDLDTTKLAEVYQSLQKTVHPDRFAHASSQEQLLAVQKSSMINDAYQTLKKPLTRATYIITLRGTEMPNEQASFGDTAFLMHQMELREMLAEIRDSDDIEAAIFNAAQTLDEEYQQLFNVMQAQINENTPETNLLASDNLRKLKFYQKLQIELDRLEETLLDD